MYGNDWVQSKLLSEELGLEKFILWLPVMERKNIFEIIDKCHVGASEFYTDAVFWGGTAWEIMAKGKPLLQSLNISGESFKQSFGYEAPPILRVTSQESITLALVALHDSEQFRKNISQETQRWFFENSGHKSAEKIIDLFKN